MRAILVESNKRIIREIVVTRNYKEYYKLLECDIFDVAMTSINGNNISIFVDDEGLLKSGNTIVGINELSLAGNLLILGDVDRKGNTLGLPDGIEIEDIADVIYIIGETRWIRS